METTLKRRLEGLTGAIAILAEGAKAQRKVNEDKAKLARSVIGLPYYWGEYSGTLHPAQRETDVEAQLIHQVTGAKVYWSLDAYHVMEHLDEIKGYSTWKEYDAACKLSCAKEIEQLLIKCGKSDKEIMKKMTEHCSKFKIPYKTYYQEVS
ncbi:hypothetical protein ACFVS2_20900 [Brevibacillus sp. NPDC058079]|uniref:hypothetical protein n=1 Tax=Brevibacillus sp. NPDC058079 TaxID=3346330 RepID=UPI0036E3CBE6